MKPGSTPTGDTWERIEAKLIGAKSALIGNGAVVRRRISPTKAVWVVRYRITEHGKTSQKSVYLGSEEMAERARTLIRDWRKQAVPAEDRLKLEVLESVNAQARLADLSGRGRQRLRRFVKGSVDDRLALIAFALGFMPTHDPAIRNGKRPGRPTRSGLW